MPWRESGACEVSLSASQREAAVYDGSLSEAQRESAVCDSSLSASQREAAVCDVSLSASQREAAVCDGSLSEAQREAAVCDVRLSASQRESVVCDVRLSASQRESVVCDVSLSASQRESVVCDVSLAVSLFGLAKAIPLLAEGKKLLAAMPMVLRVVVGFGANLGNRLETMRRALKELGRIARIDATSHVFSTSPVGPPQPDYLNAAALVTWDQSPEALLVALLEIEALLGRVRTERFGPRTIDLDVL